MKKNFTVLILILVTASTFAQKLLTIDEIYTNRNFFGDRLIGEKWFDEGSKLSYLKYDSKNGYSIYELNAETGKERIFLAGNDLVYNNETIAINNYEFSNDSKLILITGVLRARTTKSGGNFYVYDRETRKIILAVESEEIQENVGISPDSKKIAFVRSNNLFIVDIKTGTEKQLTFNGSETILNGKFDWVYEEEFSIIKGWEFSTDSKTIAFWNFDQSEVPEIQIAEWDSINFNFIKYRYPKAGFPNSKVKIGAVKIESGNINWMNLSEYENEDFYIPRIKFTNDPEILSVQKLNRLQNDLKLFFCNVNTGAADLVLHEKNETWIDIHDNLNFFKNNDFIWTSDRDGFNHLYLYDAKGNLKNQITNGNFDTDEVKSIDIKEKRVYYTSLEKGRRFSDLYSIKFDGTQKKELTKEFGVHNIIFSSNSKYYVDKFSNSKSLVQISLNKNNGKKIIDIIKNDMSVFDEYNLPKTEFFKFTTSDNIELDAFIIKPVNFDSTKKYPVIIVQYNGPGSLTLKDRWGSVNYLWQSKLTQMGFIVVGVDCRITAGNGNRHKKYAYKNLGEWEIFDLIETTKYLAEKSFVDTDRIGIWGWSYGGYTSSLAILKAADYFKAAVAVAPVTHWKFYDSIYTERYMQTPQLNPEGYEKSSPLNYADKLKGKFLLIHGTADDNVHFQNSVELVDELINKNKQFKTMYYPGKDHSIYGGVTRIQLFNMITDFFAKNL